MKIPVLYIAGTILFGVICAAGIVAMSYHPPDIQVQLHQYAPLQTPAPYQPAPAPAPAIPTVAPSVIQTRPFDPAPAPVIVTTIPLPTVTSVPVTTVGRCDPTQSDGTMTECAMEETVVQAMNLILTISPFVMVATIFLAAINLLGIFSRDRGEY